MKSVAKFLFFLGVLCSSIFCFSLDREAFSITNYDLTVQIDGDLHRLGVRGKITLRNDSLAPQKIALLQVSSSLGWRAVRVGDQAVQYITQTFTSDIDHTGSLSEAIVTLPQAVAPRATIDLEIAYEGVIVLDATRLTRIGTPQDVAQHSDWDQIGADFTAVRGAGYVAWYPIATDSANLSEGDSLSEVLGRWKVREAGSQVHIKIGMARDSRERPGFILLNQPSCFVLYGQISRSQAVTADCKYQSLEQLIPTFVIADYGFVDRPSITVYNLPGDASAAEAYADAAGKLAPFVAEWFGQSREKAKVAELPDPEAAPFESGSLLLTPLANLGSDRVALAAVHQLTHTSLLSYRPWIEEGLAHFAQALYIEQQKGRQTALSYMEQHRSAFIDAEKPTTVPRSEDETNGSLVNTTSEALYRGKAMYVWWMLRDMIGDGALKKALTSYHADQDNDPSYMPRLIAGQSQRDLAWFFDDWVYRDRGLPDFKVDSVFAEKSSTNLFLSTITVENLGAAGAEVPLTVKYPGGEVSQRLVVRGNNKVVIRVETSAAPEEVTVNDGSVPESDTTNNVYKIEAKAK